MSGGTTSEGPDAPGPDMTGTGTARPDVHGPAAVLPEDVARRLAGAGQHSLLAYLRTPPADPEARRALLSRAAAIDWSGLLSTYEKPPFSAENARVPRRLRNPDDMTGAERDAYAAHGKQVYLSGAVAATMVAGGQGTRLGFTGPKGCFEIGAVSGMSIYELHAKKIAALSSRYGVRVPLLLMTSPATDAETRRFFERHSDFGLAAGQVRFFSQGTVPSLSGSGEALFAGPDVLLENPDGHGGFFDALSLSGQLDALDREGVKYLVFNQVDNVLCRFDDTLLVGIADKEGAEVVVKAVRKVDVSERMGNVVDIDGRTEVIEYTELSADDLKTTAADGTPLFGLGSTAMYCVSVPFLKRVRDEGWKPPLHKSRKPLDVYDPAAGTVTKVDGYKNERFFHDVLLLPSGVSATVLIVAERDREFAPVKNAEGSDCAATARELASAEYKRWFRAAGMRVPEGLLEVSPDFAATEEQFVDKVRQNPGLAHTVTRGDNVLVR